MKIGKSRKFSSWLQRSVEWGNLCIPVDSRFVDLRNLGVYGRHIDLQLVKLRIRSSASLNFKDQQIRENCDAKIRVFKNLCKYT